MPSHAARVLLVALLVPASVALAAAAVPRVLAGLQADFLYGPALLHDLSRDGLAVAWRTPPAPYLLPDLVFLAVGLAVGGTLGAAYGVAVLLHVTALALALAALLRACAPAVAFSRCVGAALAATVLYLAAIAGHRAEVELLMPTCHGNALPLGIATLALVVAALRDPSRRGRDALLLALVAVGTFSDRILLAQFVLPILASIAATAALGKLAMPAALRAGAPLALGSALGIALRPLLRRSGFVTVPSPPTGLEPGELPATFLRFARDLPDLVEPVWTLAGAVALVAALAWLLRGRDALRRETRAVPVTALLLGCLATLAAPLLTGGWVDVWSARYLAPIYLFPLVLVLILWFDGSMERRVPWLLPTAALCATLPVLWTTAVRGLPSWQTPYPELVRRLDALAEARGLEYGLGDYWHAKPTTLLSRRGLRVNQLEPGGEVLFWINNLRWYFPEPEPRYRFLLVDRLETQALEARFGVPDEIIELGGSSVWLYGAERPIPTGALRREVAEHAERSGLRAGPASRSGARRSLDD